MIQKIAEHSLIGFTCTVSADQPQMHTKWAVEPKKLLPATRVRLGVS